MPKNIEVKGRLADPAAAHGIARRLSGAAPECIEQTDVFFRCSSGRLKLRVLSETSGELIQYQRVDAEEARASEYAIAWTPEPDQLSAVLTRALGQLGSVKKTRWLYLVGQTRIHIDEVEGLGDFIELEVVLRPGQDEAEGHAIAESLMRELKIQEVVPTAYIDLLRGAELR